MEHSYIQSPLGWLKLSVADNQVFAIDRVRAKGSSSSHLSPIMTRLQAQLREYFAGKRQKFDLPLAERGTPFQRQVWRKMAQIPYGRSLSYGDLAAQVGKPGAARAVGSACGKNPWLILVPCHRVLAANGGMGGFALGLKAKQCLLNLEQ
ncbi:MAG: methylated-DNA--[protein]-cysteine S-methyltransferase [Bdellovibrionaceae bacterium]|nr:methylated-DNA--[protein]-cysteine S-methyltransferase [Bdellovibrionales bacterium]MCB9086112.1 methylated-DNA--[protein]-cysteine S-methyltransferase [Pseudobdellovibrionaceae bacterium]